MKIVVFAGSNSEKSINLKLATYASSFFKDDSIKILRISDYETPLYSPEREKQNGIPELIEQFASEISQSDLIILSLAEHNGSYSAAFKNLYDWISRIPNRKVWDGKPMLLLSTSPGGRGGAGVMKAALERFPRDGAQVAAHFSLPSFNDNFDSEQNRLTNDSLIIELREVISKVMLFVKTLNR